MMVEGFHLTKERVESKLAELIESGKLDSNTEKLVSLRFGIGTEKPLTIQEISRVLKRPQKKIRQEIETAERRVFNHLKDHV